MLFKISSNLVSASDISVHNHDINEKTFLSYTSTKTKILKSSEPVQKLLNTLIQAKTTTYNQTKAVNSELGVSLSHQDIKNGRSSFHNI